MGAITSQGCILAVSVALPATVDAAGFAALSYTTVGELTDIPEFGAETTVVTHDPLASGTTQKLKGQTNNGSQSLGGALDEDDAGQLILISANEGADKDNDVSVKITYPDASVRYYYGKVFSYKENIGAANNVIAFMANFEINSIVVRVAAP